MKVPRRTISFSLRLLLDCFVVVHCFFSMSDAATIPKSIGQYNHSVWQTENGLPQNSVTAILQSSDGYLWLGTLEGLVRFDGVRFTVFDHTNTEAIQSNRILALCCDRKGAIWCGTENGGLTRYSDGQFKTLSSEEGLSYTSVSSILEDHEGNLWIGTPGGGLFKYRNDQFTSYTTNDGLSSNIIRAMCEDDEHTLWIGTDGGGVTALKDGRFIHYSVADGLVNDEVWSLCSGKNRSLWIGTAAGLSKFQDGRFTSYTEKDGLANNFVWSIYERRDGSLLIGTQGGGLHSMRDGLIETFNATKGLSNNFVWSLLEDLEGNIWIGTNGGGLNRLNDGMFTSYTTLEGLSNDFVWSICQDRENALWIGTYDGLNRFKDGRFTTYTTHNGLSNNFVWSVYADKDGSMWIGTADGLNHFDGEKFKTFRIADGIASNSIRSLYQDKSGDLWVGTAAGLTRLHNGTFTSYTMKDGLPNDLVMAIAEDSSGTFWIGTGKGLYALRNGKFTRYTKADGLSNDGIRVVYIDGDGTVWIGTQGGGLNCLHNGKFVSLTTKNGLFDDVVSQILEDDHGNFWMSCNKGIFRAKKEDLKNVILGKRSSIISMSYGTADGMMSRECNGSSQPAGCRTRDGHLWFPTIKGVAMVDPGRSVNDLVPPLVNIEKVLVNKVLHDPKHPIVVSPGQGELEVEYTGLCFAAPEKLRFKYMLEGFDKDWVSVGSRRTAYYTNLPPGRFTFRVKVSTTEELWNGYVDFVSVELQPHVYQQKWFYAMCGVCAIGIGFGAYRYRIRRLRAREAKLISLVVERTKHFQQQKENAEQARVEAERQKQIALEANQVKTELLNIAAHDLKSPLVSIKMLSRIIMEETKQPSPVMDFATDIYSASQKMHTLINELLESAWIESGNIALNLKHVDLSQIAETVSLDNKISADQKKQKIVLKTQWGCIVIADEERLRECVDNLISNAVKYSPLEKVIQVTVRDCGSTIRLEVKDEGPGLTQDDRKNLFGKFQRLSAKPTAGEPSTGLGLSIVKQLVELQGGKVSVESVEGRGSTFIISFAKAEM